MTGSPDDPRFGLIMAASHPAIAAEVRGPLILQTVFGVSVADMADAFLVPAATLSQRLVRAKAKIKAARIPFEPDPEHLPDRIGGARNALYGLHTVARASERNMVAHARAADALALAQLLAARLPDDPETLGLAALLAYSEARQRAVRDEKGAYVPLSQQDPALWDVDLIAEAERHLTLASHHHQPGPYQLMAAIQSAHTSGRRCGRTPWEEIAALYDVLLTMMPTAGVATARAAAHCNAFGQAAGLRVLAEADTAGLCPAGYQPYWALKAHLSEGTDAELAYAEAIALARDDAVREHLRALAASKEPARH